MSSKGGSSALNNYLQNNSQLSSLSWQDSTSGPKNAPTWTSICKINGVPRGQGTGTHKHIARDIAANAALQSLTEDNA
ncbi:putative double-stranded RNA binding motif containing protein [Lyophyllum shimeji]|uniref:Double-stranded RNA binding motif containing protein n=1 Tax=Lyophyllum shimeji TaxID=47721 RepID=A0A9P3PGX7_LYOSH|nr:putative double-stranded RNA binding motif containing protein [Lyophyllum shimeji]